MTIRSTRAAVRAAAAALAFGGFFALAAPATAAKLGPYFPIPNGVSITGIPKDSLIAANVKWLENSLDNLKKAREKEAGDKQQEIDALISQTEEELKLAKDTNPSHEVQKQRKDALLLNLNQWINELERLATEQMKRAILSDGAEKMEAEARNSQLSEQGEKLEKAKNDNSMQNWK